MTSLSTPVTSSPLVREEAALSNNTGNIKFTSVAAEALRKLHSKKGNLHPPIQNSLAALPLPSEAPQPKIGVRFHLSKLNGNFPPLELPTDHLDMDNSVLRSEEAGVHPTASDGLRFCWLRGQSSAGEEFITWTREHGESRGTLVNLQDDLAEFETRVKVPTGCRWFARAIDADGNERDLQGIVSSRSEFGDGLWLVTCKLISRRKSDRRASDLN